MFRKSVYLFFFFKNIFYICTPKIKQKGNDKGRIGKHHLKQIRNRKNDTQKVIEAFMQEIRTSMYNGDNVYLRGFGSFVIKTRAAKQVEIFLKNTAINIPAHNIPAFKPSKTFVEKLKLRLL